jgi:Tfp pilus assembly protein PilF
MDVKIDEAESLIRKAVALAPKDGYITDSLGWLFYKKGQYQDAVDTLEKAIALVPDDPIILEHLGDAYSKLNGREKALEYYKRSLSVKKEDTADLKKKIEELSARDEL